MKIYQKLPPKLACSNSFEIPKQGIKLRSNTRYNIQFLQLKIIDNIEKSGHKIKDANPVMAIKSNIKF